MSRSQTSVVGAGFRRGRMACAGAALAVATTLVGARQAAAAGSGLTVASGPTLSNGPLGNPFTTPPTVIGSTLTNPSGVATGDTFSLAVAGFNASTGEGIFVTSLVDPTFGTTTSYTGGALGGQVLTVTSHETVGASTTTDTVTVSVPTNFVPTGTRFNGASVNNQTIDSLELDIGEYNGGSDPINFLLPASASSLTTTGSILYGTTPTSLTLAPTPTLSTDGLSLATFEGVDAPSPDISSFNVRQFTFSATYSTAVPEPTSLGLLGAAGTAALGRRRRRTPGAAAV